MPSLQFGSVPSVVGAAVVGVIGAGVVGTPVGAAVVGASVGGVTAHGASFSSQLIPEFATVPPQQLADPPGRLAQPDPPQAPQVVGQQANPLTEMIPLSQLGSPAPVGAAVVGVIGAGVVGTPVGAAVVGASVGGVTAHGASFSSRLIPEFATVPPQQF